MASYRKDRGKEKAELTAGSAARPENPPPGGSADRVDLYRDVNTMAGGSQAQKTGQPKREPIRPLFYEMLRYAKAGPAMIWGILARYVPKLQTLGEVSVRRIEKEWNLPRHQVRRWIRALEGEPEGESPRFLKVIQRQLDSEGSFSFELLLPSGRPYKKANSPLHAGKWAGMSEAFLKAHPAASSGPKHDEVVPPMAHILRGYLLNPPRDRKLLSWKDIPADLHCTRRTLDSAKSQLRRLGELHGFEIRPQGQNRTAGESELPRDKAPSEKGHESGGRGQNRTASGTKPYSRKEPQKKDETPRRPDERPPEQDAGTEPYSLSREVERYNGPPDPPLGDFQTVLADQGIDLTAGGEAFKKLKRRKTAHGSVKETDDLAAALSELVRRVGVHIATEALRRLGSEDWSEIRLPAKILLLRAAQVGDDPKARSPQPGCGCVECETKRETQGARLQVEVKNGQRQQAEYTLQQLVEGGGWTKEMVDAFESEYPDFRDWDRSKVGRKAREWHRKNESPKAGGVVSAGRER